MTDTSLDQQTWRLSEVDNFVKVLFPNGALAVVQDRLNGLHIATVEGKIFARYHVGNPIPDEAATIDIVIENPETQERTAFPWKDAVVNPPTDNVWECKWGGIITTVSRPDS